MCGYADYGRQMTFLTASPSETIFTTAVKAAILEFGIWMLFMKDNPV